MFNTPKHIKLLQKEKYSRLCEQIQEQLSLQPENFDQTLQAVNQFHSKAIQLCHADFVLENYRQLKLQYGDDYLQGLEHAKTLTGLKKKIHLYMYESISDKLAQVIRLQNFREILQQSEYILFLNGPWKKQEEEQKEESIRLLGNSLSSVITEKNYVEGILSKLARKCGCKAYSGPLTRQCQDRWTTYYQSQSLQSGHSSKLYRIELLKTSLSYLPTSNDFGDPAEDDLIRFISYLHSLFATAFSSKELKTCAFNAIGQLIIEFNPHEASSISKSSGIEDRYYQQLGLKARKTVNRSMKKLAQIERLLEFGKFFLKRIDDEHESTLALEIIGMLRNPDYQKPLSKIIFSKQTLKDKNMALVGLSRIATKRNADFLLNVIKKFVKKREIDFDERPVFEDSLEVFFKVITLPDFDKIEKAHFLEEFWKISSLIDDRYLLNAYFLLLQRFKNELSEREYGYILVRLMVNIEKKANNILNQQENQKLITKAFRIFAQNKELFYPALNNNLENINFKPNNFLITLLDFIIRNPAKEVLPLLAKIAQQTYVFYSRTLSEYQKPEYFNNETQSSEDLNYAVVQQNILKGIEHSVGVEDPLYMKVLKQNPQGAKKKKEETAPKKQVIDRLGEAFDTEITDQDRKRLEFQKKRAARKSAWENKRYEK